MYVCGCLTVPAKKDRNFSCENLQKIVEDFLKNFQVSLGITASFICLPKSQKFASLQFIVMKIV